jgi:hypothetical protein
MQSYILLPARIILGVERMNKDISSAKKEIADKIRETIANLNDLIRSAHDLKLEVLLPKIYDQKTGSEKFLEPIIQERIEY